MKSIANQEQEAASHAATAQETPSQRARRIGQNWRIVNDLLLEKEFKFPDFRHALEFTKRVGEIAEEENHHPDIHLTYGLVCIHISTHEAHALTPEDFNLASRIDELHSA